MAWAVVLHDWFDPEFDVGAMGEELELMARFPDSPPVRLMKRPPVLARREEDVGKGLPAASRPRRRVE